MNRQEEQTKYTLRQLDPLIGGKLAQTILVDDGYGDLWPGFLVKKGQKTYLVTISRDPEGNGPGHVFVELR